MDIEDSTKKKGSQMQKSGEAVKRLNRLAPNLVHVCGFVWELTYAKYNSSLNTEGAFPGGGFRRSKFKSLRKLSNGWADWHQLWYTSVDSSGNGHRLNTIRPTIPHGGILGFLGGQQFKRLGNVVKRLDRLRIHFTHIMQMNLGMDTCSTNWPHETPGEHFDARLSRGNLFGYRGGVNISSKVWGMP